MNRKKLPHLQAHSIVNPLPYSGKQFPPDGPPFRNHSEHSKKLLSNLKSAFENFERRQASEKVNITAPLGVMIQVDGLQPAEMHFGSLDPVNQKWSLRNVRVAENKWSAAVWVGKNNLTEFTKKFSDYATELTRTRKPKNQSWIGFIDDITLAGLESLWNGNESFPKNDEIWWEIWLSRRTHEEGEEFRKICNELDIPLSKQEIHFHDASVLLAKATPEALSKSLLYSNSISEVRRASIITNELNIMKSNEQHEWVSVLSSQLSPAGHLAPIACILDSGVNRGHPLLDASLSESDCHNHNPTWAHRDRDSTGQPHGTGMASIALLGDIRDSIDKGGEIKLTHRLESVKILETSHTHAPELYGLVIARATSLAEIQNPKNKRANCLAVTADCNLGGMPTSWSAALDALSCGRSILQEDSGNISYLDDYDPKFSRLFLISAGNSTVPETPTIHRIPKGIQDPAQSWNSITVGAYTQFECQPPSNFTLISEIGDASPFTRDSLEWESIWPIKPDVVMEGGNGLSSGLIDDTIISHDELSVLAANSRFATGNPMCYTQGTSPATAFATNLAAKIWAKYPNFRSETVRALIVHSARWTDRMFDQIRPLNASQRILGMRLWGHGVPDEDYALNSTSSRLSLIHEGIIHPFQNGKFKEYHLIDLPWPIAELENMSDDVTLRITLSYNIQPNPSSRAWRGRYSYASHGLRFKVRPPLMSDAQFRETVVKSADGGFDPISRSGSKIDWYFGPGTQNKGSLHSDYCEMSGADIARCGQIAVYPVTGWWKEQHTHDKSSDGVPYSVVISIEPKQTDIDIYTPVKSAIENRIATRIPV